MALNRNMHEDLNVFCVACGDKVPADRVARGATTCKKACATKRKNMLRSQRDAKSCRYCRKPSTPEERRAFNRFRLLEVKRPDLLYPFEFAAWSHDAPSPTPEIFAEYWKTTGNTLVKDLRSVSSTYGERRGPKPRTKNAEAAANEE